MMCHYFMGNVFNDRWILSREHHPEWGDAEKDEPWTMIDFGKKGRVDPERSISKYRDVWKLAPNYVQSHHQAGIVYMKLGSYFREKGDEQSALLYWNKALESFWKYHKIDPIFYTNYQRMAWVYLQLGNMKMVEDVYKGHISVQWLCQGPEDVINPKKMNQEQKQKYDELVAQFNEEKNWFCCDYHKREHYIFARENWAVRRAHEYSESYMQLANLYYLRKDYTNAEKFYERSRKTNKENLQAWRNLMILYRETNKQPQLNALIESYRNTFPKDVNLSQLGTAK